LNKRRETHIFAIVDREFELQEALGYGVEACHSFKPVLESDLGALGL
jgi:hypothetical protein